MAQRIDVFTFAEDGRAKTLESELARLGHKASVKIIDSYTLEQDIEDPATLEEVRTSFVNPVTQTTDLSTLPKFSWALEIGFLPGVTDNIGHTAKELVNLTLTPPLTPPQAGGKSAQQSGGEVYSSQTLLIDGDLDETAVKVFAAQLHNPLIQRASWKDYQSYSNDNGMDIVIPKVLLDNKGAAVDEISLDIPDDALEKIGKDGIENADGTRRGPLGMSLLYMKAVQDYFKGEGRAPKDIEIETVAQTWSEHCKHTIFASPIDEVKDGLYKHYIKRATQEIRAEKGKDDFCVSVFSDNSGGIVFDNDWMITDKVETHNSPSALDPFGGAITGIVGVNRDCIGFGLGAKPVMNRYGFCLADPRTNPEYYRGKNKTNRMLSPETILKGVVSGVESGGNQSGIPTPQGFLYFDDRFVGKPLVFAGTVGLIPREINGKPSHEKGARPGDKILMVGGKVGRDGIHGATFSSVALDEGSPATAVQIGDPITQKKLSDALVKEIRDLGLYSAVSDNGAGGLSSSVGEMGEASGGFLVELDTVPLKYPGMQPWEIWISESQERMSLAVPPENVATIQEMFEKRGCESWVIGTFTDTGRAQISWKGEIIMDMAMDFLHDGLPETPLATTFTPGGEAEPNLPEPDYKETILKLLGSLNICSKEFVSYQYDYNVQGSAVTGPLQGPGRVGADASVSRPVLDNPRGAVLSQGLFPRYSDIDTGHMAAASLDMAVRAAVAAGCPIDHLAILDNFCWCSSDEPERLGQLKRACEAIYDLSKIYGTPFISGKDSMFNDFKGYDGDDNPVKISIPPTLLVSGIGVIPNVDQAVSIDPKAEGDLVYLLGETRDECGAGEYYALNGKLGGNVPQTDGKACMTLYKALTEANGKYLCASAIPLSYGGLAAALAKSCIASGLGLSVTLKDDMRLDRKLFSESTGRVVVSIDPKNKEEFESLSLRHNVPCTQIGSVTKDKVLRINEIEISIDEMDNAYRTPLGEF